MKDKDMFRSHFITKNEEARERSEKTRNHVNDGSENFHCGDYEKYAVLGWLQNVLRAMNFLYWYMNFPTVHSLLV